MRNLKCISVQRMLLSSAFLLASLFFAQGVSAAEYKWYYSGTGPRYTSASAACSAWVTLTSKPLGTRNTEYRFDPYVGSDSSPAQMKCYYSWIPTYGDGSYNATPVYKANVYVYREGTECPVNTTYNATTGECKGDPCLPTAGKRIRNEHKWGVINGARTEPPIQICENSCQYSNTFENQSCLRNFKEDKESGYCSFDYVGNGMSCTTSSNPAPGSIFDQPPTKPPTSPAPTNEQSTKCDSWVTAADGTKSRNCTANSNYKDPGKLNCTSGSGTLVCSPGSPSPDYKDKTDVKTETTKTNADGSKSDSSSTTTTTTVCKGADKCTTTTTTKTDSKDTNADGTPGDEESTCTGDDCDPDKPDEEEEEKECDPATDPDKCGQSSVSGEACDATVDCSGDAIQCAILRSQKKQQCDDKEFREITDKKVTDLKSELNSEFAGPDYQPLKPGSEGAFDMAGMIDTSGVFSRACPNIPDLSVPWIEGTATIRLQDISSNLCFFFTWMGYLIVAFAMRSAAEIIANGMN